MTRGSSKAVRAKATAEAALPAAEAKALLALTALPTAAGREDAVIAWVRRWAKTRRGVTLDADAAGNLLIARSSVPASPRPVVLVAHMDHPAFVVAEATDRGRRVEAAFRGGVEERFFEGAAVRLWRRGEPVADGAVRETRFSPDDRSDKRVVLAFDVPTDAEPGDVVTWALPSPRLAGGRLTAPACDNLAGVAAALCAFDRVRRRKRDATDLRVLLTRAEEVGFVGAIAACRSRTLPKAARVVVLENSKAFAESPSGGGTVVRVGDRTSTFDADVTRRLAVAAEGLERADASFRWMRRLMPGGTCEATAFVAFGYRAGCVCLPLTNYHNMDADRGVIASESVAVGDFAHTVSLLAAAAPELAGDATPVLRRRFDQLYRRQRRLLKPAAASK